MRSPAPVRRTHRWVLPVLLATIWAVPARADTPDEALAEARAEYTRGNELAKSSQWAQALAAFERSFELRPHPLTVYNMGVCERALGRVVRARELFREAVSGAEKDGAQFPASRLVEARGFEAEMTASLVQLDLRVSPEGARIAVDGRPLRVETAEGAPRAVAGLEPPGEPTAVPASRFTLVVDPGTHVFRVAAPGYADVLLTRSYTPGAKTSLDIELATLPAAVRVRANVARAVVLLDGGDVGLAPVQLSRPAGAYRLRVAKDGYEPFETVLTVTPGQELDVPATLVVQRTPITKTWWFWSAVAGAVAGGAALTYALTREPGAPPPYSGGTSGWVVTPR